MIRFNLSLHKPISKRWISKVRYQHGNLLELDQLKKMGSLEGVLAMLPGAQKAKAQMAQSNITDHALSQQEAIIRSMTKAERRNPIVLNGSRRKWIASGSGTTVQDVNKILKQFKQMQKMFKKVGK